MTSHYKYFPSLLLEYSKKPSEPVKVYNSNIVSFHYSQPEPPHFIQNFSINPFSEDPVTSHFEPMIESKQELEKVKGPFTNMTWDEKTFEEIPSLRMTIYPMLYIPHDTWWEYENFKKFPDYPNWYLFKFKEFHKHMTMSKYQTVTYDPLWSVEANLELSVYYYSTTLKYYKPWKNQESSGELYQSTRPFIYFLAFLSFFSYHITSSTIPKSDNYKIYLSEDYWHRDYKTHRFTYDPSNPYNAVVGDQILSFYNSGLFKFQFGPAGSKHAIEQYKKYGKMSKEEYFEKIKE